MRQIARAPIRPGRRRHPTSSESAGPDGRRSCRFQVNQTRWRAGQISCYPTRARPAVTDRTFDDPQAFRPRHRHRRGRAGSSNRASTPSTARISLGRKGPVPMMATRTSCRSMPRRSRSNASRASATPTASGRERRITQSAVDRIHCWPGASGSSRPQSASRSTSVPHPCRLPDASAASSRSRAPAASIPRAPTRTSSPPGNLWQWSVIDPPETDPSRAANR